MITEIDEKQFKQLLQDEELVAAFFHTPFCGTCTLAKKLLETVTGRIKQTYALVSCDLNRMPSLAEPLQIMTVPSLVLFKNGEPLERFVAFGSVEELYYLLTKFSALR